ncbi:hypothetical protein L1887_47100 [Cichorium endivia]|nr:hypothetical protein L1887_47100 [Cichorium endivia]
MLSTEEKKSGRHVECQLVRVHPTKVTGRRRYVRTTHSSAFGITAFDRLQQNYSADSRRTNWIRYMRHVQYRQPDNSAWAMLFRHGYFAGAASFIAVVSRTLAPSTARTTWTFPTTVEAVVVRPHLHRVLLPAQRRCLALASVFDA